MNASGPWHTRDFDHLSWHDVHVHGIRLESFKPDNGTSDVVFDIDFILKWENAKEGFLFTVCAADLYFHDVFGLKLNLDYASPTAGMCPFSLDRIERKEVMLSTNYKSYDWDMKVNWPKGRIEFQAPGFTQVLVGAPQISPNQWLPPEARRSVAV